MFTPSLSSDGIMSAIFMRITPLRLGDWYRLEEDLRERKCDDGGCRRPRKRRLVTNCPRQMSGPSTRERGCHGIGVDGFAARQLRMRMIDMLGIYYFTHTQKTEKR